MKRLFSKCLANNVLPSLRKCADVIADNEILQNRTPQQLKAFINNEMKRTKRVSEEEDEKKVKLHRKMEIRESFEKRMKNDSFFINKPKK